MDGPYYAPSSAGVGQRGVHRGERREGDGVQEAPRLRLVGLAISRKKGRDFGLIGIRNPQGDTLLRGLPYMMSAVGGGRGVPKNETKRKKSADL